MKNTLKLVTAAAFAAGLALSAHAQVASYGDLVLGFEAASGTGSSTNLEVDLGSATYFMNAGAGTYTIANLGTDLASTYGSDWASNGALTYSVIGSSSVTTGVSNAGGSFAKKIVLATSSSGQPTGAGTNAYNTAISNIGNAYGLTGASGAFGGNATTNLSDLTGASTGLGTTLEAYTTATSNGGSFTNVKGASNFSIPTNGGLVLGQVAGSGLNNTLFELLSTTTSGANQPLANTLGGSYFTLDASTGALTFTVGSVIPEPSFYAAAIVALTVGVVLFRRKNQLSLV